MLTLGFTLYHRIKGMIELDIQILYKSQDFIVCVKPAGVLSESPGLPDLVCRQEKTAALYPVHRLDLGTGGLIILAKTPSACTRLTGFFAGGKVQKSYLAVVEGAEISDYGTYTDLLYHDRFKNKSYVVKTPRKGVKEASCEWRRIQSLDENGKKLHLISIELHTGRTHQIRVQFASRGMPLFGDQRYGSKNKAPVPALWACGLRFPDPSDMEKKHDFFMAPPDADPWRRFSRAFRGCDTDADVIPGQSD